MLKYNSKDRGYSDFKHSNQMYYDWMNVKYTVAGAARVV